MTNKPTPSTYEQEAKKVSDQYVLDRYNNCDNRPYFNEIACEKDFISGFTTACNMRREELEAKDREIWYWRERCKLAEDCSEKSPCDPDITTEQIEAWGKYHSFIKEHGGKPY